MAKLLRGSDIFLDNQENTGFSGSGVKTRSPLPATLFNMGDLMDRQIGSVEPVNPPYNNVTVNGNKYVTFVGDTYQKNTLPRAIIFTTPNFYPQGTVFNKSFLPLSTNVKINTTIPTTALLPANVTLKELWNSPNVAKETYLSPGANEIQFIWKCNVGAPGDDISKRVDVRLVFKTRIIINQTPQIMNTLELSYKLNPISSPDLEVYDNVIFYFYDYTYSLFPNSDRSGWDTIKVESAQPSLPEFSVDSFPLSPGAVMPFTVSSLEITEQITNYNITFLFDYRDRVINIFKNIDFQKQMGLWVSNLFFSKETQ